MSPTRRQVLKWGVGAGALAGLGVAGRALLPPSPSARIAPVDELSARLFDALSPDERADACFDYDHPLRQYHNRGVDTGGTWSIRLGRTARQLLVDLVHAGLSEAGRERLTQQFFVSLPGIHATRLAIFGEPGRGPAQILVTGPHLNLRLGGKNREGVAFGGPQVYGDQRGNGEVGLPGNVYRYQLEAGQRLIASLTRAERKAVRHDRAPVQTLVEVQGRAGVFDGPAVGELGAKSRTLARDMIGGILDTYAAEDAGYAWECIERNGGVDALHLADYDRDHQPGRNVAGGASQIIRLEGPAAVFHYRGEPHLHAFINVAMDGEHPLSVGEVVGINDVPLDSSGVKRWFEQVMLAHTGADIAYYDLESVAGRLRAGPVRTGDLYNLESWRNDVVVLEVEGSDLAEPIVRAFRERGDTVRPGSVYRVATESYIAAQRSEELIGRILGEETGPMLRDVAIEHGRRHGFSIDT